MRCTARTALRRGREIHARILSQATALLPLPNQEGVTSVSSLPFETVAQFELQPKLGKKRGMASFVRASQPRM